MSGGGNSLKEMHVEEGVHVKWTGMNKGEKGSKTGSFEQMYFLNDLKYNLQRNKCLAFGVCVCVYICIKCNIYIR